MAWKVSSPNPWNQIMTEEKKMRMMEKSLWWRSQKGSDNIVQIKLWLEKVKCFRRTSSGARRVSDYKNWPGVEWKWMKRNVWDFWVRIDRHAQDKIFSCYKSRKVQMHILGQLVAEAPIKLLAKGFIHSYHLECMRTALTHGELI